MIFRWKDAELDKQSRIDLLPLGVLLEVGQVARMGAEKYGERNIDTAVLKGLVNNGSFLGAALRHIIAWSEREDIDKESGLSHIVHAIWNLMMLAKFNKSGLIKDDRSEIT